MAWWNIGARRQIGTARRGLRAGLGLSLGLALLLPGGNARAAAAVALPDALSLVGVTCSSLMGNDNRSYGPLPVGLSTQCDESGESPQGRFGTARWSGSATAATGLGSQTGGLGLAEGAAHAFGENINGRVSAGGGGWVNFVWRVSAAAAAPFVPDLVPVRFVAMGEGHVEGEGPFYGGQVQASAWLDLPDFPRQSFRFDSGEQYNGGSIDRQFGGSTVVGVTPGQTLSGGVHANCWVIAIGSVRDGVVPQPLSSSADCVVSADPQLSLDQAAFDARYGAAAYRLADYYQLDYSANVPVPEPAGAWLWLCGLAGLAARRWRVQ